MFKLQAPVVATLIVIATFATVSNSQPSAAGDDQKTSKSVVFDSHMQPLAGYVGGQWVIHGQWNDGSELHAREVHEASLDGRIIRSRTFVTKPDGSEYQRYESISFWHPEKKQLMFHSYAFDGTVSQGTIEPQPEGVLSYPPSLDKEGKPGLIRQTIKFVDSDTMSWTVFMRNDDASEDTLIEGTWKRER